MAKTKNGLSNLGLNIPSFKEIKDEIEASIVSQLGAVDFEVPSILGTFTSIFAERELSIWEQVQNVYNSFFVDTATDISLDYVVASNLLTRLQPTNTKALCQVTGTNFTNITQGSQIKLVNDEIVFTISSPITINNENCISIAIDIIDMSKANYTITISDKLISYNTQIDDTKIIVLTALASVINLGDYGVTAALVDGILIVTSKQPNISFSCYVTAAMEFESVTANALFICNTLGNVAAPSHSLTRIQTPIQGWISVDNLVSGLTGRNLETDVELRLRHQNSLNIGGASTSPAIQSRILQVQGVTSVQVISDVINHTINTIVMGGEDLGVASMLQLVRPAGIKLIGNKQISVTDSTGTYMINFTRPDTMYIFIKIRLTVDNTFNPDSKATISSKIIDFINKLGVNNQVTYQALFVSIYSVPGVTSAEVLIGGTLNSEVEPALGTNNIAISSSQVAFTNASFITITQI